MLSVRDLNLVAGDLILAKGINLSLAPGKVHVIIGPNGTGKSTLLKAFFGEVKPQSGVISYQGLGLNQSKLSQWRQQFAYMPQDTHLDVSLRVLDVVLMGSVNSLTLRLERNTITQALDALEQVGLLHLADRNVNTLSGGQCQMVLFAQALMRQPQIVMLDEPVSALDLHYQQVLLEHLAQQTHSNHWTTLMVLHDLNLAAQYADNLIVLYQGRVKAAGAPTKVLTQSLLEEVYQVNAEVSFDANGLPFVRVYRKANITVAA